MMNRTEALEFARACAVAALDHTGDYDDPIASHRENIRDTLADERAAEYEAEAFEVFDAAIAAAKPAAAAEPARIDALFLDGNIAEEAALNDCGEDVSGLRNEPAAVTLHAEDGELYCGDHLLLVFYPAGDCDGVCWPEPDHGGLRRALYDLREGGDIPGAAVEAVLPNGETFSF